jgi:lipopolysaccharide transport system ATP-binding protein
VKRYSSGMQVRLAFAVAAHLEPEILIVDEVLAVGDIEFQRKCLGRMGEVARSGRTILFVSHNMAAIERLCTSGMVLHQGNIGFIGTQTQAVDFYVRTMTSQGNHARYITPDPGQRLEAGARIRSAHVTSSGTPDSAGFAAGAPLVIRIDCFTPESIRAPALGIGIDSGDGQRIVTLHTSFDSNLGPTGTCEGEFAFVCHLEELALVPGDYWIKLSLESNNGPLDVLENCMRVTILPSDYYGSSGKFGRGIVLCRHWWERV